MRGVVIAGTHSGVGKTTVACGLLAAFRKRGYRVQPFKAGPDYIDPSHHEAAAGVPSRNLDTRMLSEAALAELFERATRRSDLAVVEGVMGLYDGAAGGSEEGSTAHLAKRLGLPVVLVVDAAAAGASAAATALGFRAFDPQVEIAGVVLNGVAGEGHLRFIEPALQRVGIPLLGYLPRRPDLEQPERYLGLVPGAEGGLRTEAMDQLAAQVERTVDLDRLWAMLPESRPARAAPNDASLFPSTDESRRVAIGVARDRAFNFYYADSMDLLEAWGAEIKFFSPLEDSALPRGVSAIYLGGGFPEQFCAELSENRGMRDALMRAAASGMPIYGECGGLMYLGQSLQDVNGNGFPMVGLVPAQSTMKDARLTIGYRTVTPRGTHPLLEPGDSVVGHEFHLSSLTTPLPPVERSLYRVAEFGRRPEGFRVGSVCASYIHLHFGARPGMAARFVETAERWWRTQRAR